MRPIPWPAVCQKLFVKWFQREKIGNDNFLHSMNKHQLGWGGCHCLTWMANMLTFINQFLMKWYNTRIVSKLCVFIGWYPTLIQLDWQQQLLTYSFTNNLFVSKIKQKNRSESDPPPPQMMKYY